MADGSEPMTFLQALDQFEPVALPGRVLLNSVPKCGTLLLRNIAMAFAGKKAHHFPFLVDHNLPTHEKGLANPDRKLFVGHLNWGVRAYELVRDWRQVLIVRDPYDYALSQARFVHSDGFVGPFRDYLVANKVSIEDTLRFVILGAHGPGFGFAPLQSVYMRNAIAWLGRVELIRYEDLIAALRNLGTDWADAYMIHLLKKIGITDLPENWRERVAVGADRRFSATDRGNLANGVDESAIPKDLPSEFRKMIDVAAPGLRAALGY